MTSCYGVVKRAKKYLVVRQPQADAYVRLMVIQYVMRQITKLMEIFLT